VGRGQEVTKSWVPGDRRAYYEPETSIWKKVSRVFRERELQQIHAAIEAFDEVAVGLGKRRRTAAGEEAERLDFAQDRIRGLLDLARIGEALLDAMLSGRPIDAGPLVRFKKES
jgi:DNA-binding transcriptional regulator GbsR (MarR family)